MSNPRFFGTAKINNDMCNVMILMPFVQTAKNMPVNEIDFEHSLVVDLDRLNNDVAEQLTKMANNYHAGEFKTLIDYLEGKSLRNSDRVLSWLHTQGQIIKIESDKIIMKGANYTVQEINNIIRKEMLEKQPARDVDDARREQAQAYNDQLKEDIVTPNYPDFNNPSESSPDTAPHVMDEPTMMNAPVIDLSADDVKAIHQQLIERHQQSQDKLTSALEVVNSLKDTLSEASINTLTDQLKSASKNADAKEALMEALAGYYNHVDVEYIKKNLDAAERRKSKDE